MMRRPFTYRGLGAGLRVCAAMVPTADRDRWLEEWRAELWHALEGEGAWSAARRVLGAPRDAIWSRRPTRLDTPTPPGSPRRGLDALMQDLRYAVRSLIRRPGFTITAVLMLAVGIGTNAALFGAINNALLEPLPWSEPDRLLALYEDRPHQEGRDRNSLSLPDIDDWRSRSTTLESLAAFSFAIMSYTADETTPVSLVGTEVEWEFFKTLGVVPALGRDFSAADDEPGAAGTVMLSHGLWHELFAGDEDIVGRDIVLDGEPRTVIGVLPDGPAYYFNSRLWVPLRLDPAEQHRGNHRFRAIGRMHAGATIESTRADLDTIARDLEAEHPDNNVGHYAAAYAFQGEITRDISGSLWIVMGLAGVVLLIVCANLANMQLASALARQRETAVRLAIGASRRRVVTMVLVESLVIALVAAGLGFVLARVVADVALPPPPWQVGATVDGAAFGFAVILAIGTCVIFGLAPAIRLAGGDVFQAIRDGGRALGNGRTGVRGLLVATEVALAVVLVMGAGLLLRSITALTEVEVGFRNHAAVAAKVDLPPASYPEAAQRNAFYRQLVDAVTALPGVEVAGTSDTLPMAGSTSHSTFRIEGREAPENSDEWSSLRHIVAPGYFEAMEIDLVRGRTLEWSDNEDAESVAVINEDFARQFFPDGDPIGERVNIWGDQWHRIVGIVRGVRHYDVRVPTAPEVYFPTEQVASPPFAWVVFRQSSADLDLAPAVRAVVAELDAGLPVSSVFPVSTLVDRSLRSTQRLGRIVGAFGTLALVIAAMGLYGVISYSVGQRRGEIGLRMALGSTAGKVVGLIVGQGMLLVGAGLVVGLVIAWLGGPLIASVLYGVEPTDLVATLGSIGTLAVVALLASLLPALRASRIDPAGSLRAD